MSFPDHVAAITLPWSNTKVLAEKLNDGSICLSTAISHFDAVTRTTLKIFEEFSRNQVKLNLENKKKLEKMDNLISDLSEKCQSLQQALLYKEEKYDEKCREAERYKFICQLATNEYPTNTNVLSNPEEDARDDSEDEPVRQHVNRHHLPKNLKGHVKYVKSARIDTAPVTAARLHKQQDDQFRIGMSSQSARVMSTSHNAIEQMKQSFTEKNLNKVAEQSWTRMSSRKRKEWPF